MPLASYGNARDVDAQKGSSTSVEQHDAAADADEATARRSHAGRDMHTVRYTSMIYARRSYRYSTVRTVDRISHIRHNPHATSDACGKHAYRMRVALVSVCPGCALKRCVGFSACWCGGVAPHLQKGGTRTTNERKPGEAAVEEAPKSGGRTQI